MLNDPGGRAPAPGALRQVQRFVNTVDFENGIEELTDPAALEEAARRGRLTVEFAEDGCAELVPGAPGVDGALGRIVGIVHTTMADGSWPRLKACPRHICRWVFYDRSKNRNSRWCAMSVCGNRIKTAKYRRRAGTISSA